MDAIKKYILVAEDDKFYGNIFKQKLTQLGYEVEVADDGQKALDMIKAKKPDLLLLDLIMPVKDGFDVLEELKVQGVLQGMKILVLSNLGQQEDIDKAKGYGVLDYIVKASLSIQETVDRIKKYLG